MDYSMDEINEALTEMGYSAVSQDALDHIRQQVLEFGDDDVFDELLSSVGDSVIDFEEAQDLFRDDDVPEQYHSIVDLLREGQRKLTGIHTEITELDDEIEAALEDCDPDLRAELEATLALKDRQPFSFLHNIPSSTPKTKPDESQPRPKLPDIENQPMNIDKKVEKAMIDEILKQKGAVRVNCPPPGKAPFKHDPVKRNAQYQDCWKKFPIPGEQRRLSLRWKIRNLMLTRDIPRIELVPNPGLEPRKDWIA